jgi:hypothetical protein
MSFSSGKLPTGSIGRIYYEFFAYKIFMRSLCCDDYAGIKVDQNNLSTESVQYESSTFYSRSVGMEVPGVLVVCVVAIKAPPEKSVIIVA